MFGWVKHAETVTKVGGLEIAMPDRGIPRQHMSRIDPN